MGDGKDVSSVSRTLRIASPLHLNLLSPLPAPTSQPNVRVLLRILRDNDWGESETHAYLLDNSGRRQAGSTTDAAKRVTAKLKTWNWSLMESEPLHRGKADRDRWGFLKCDGDDDRN